MVVDVATLLADVVAALAAHRDELDAINVFPVPDGDTGSNMVATARTAADAAAGATGPAAQLGAAVAAALAGARGNSGLLLSQVLRGIHEAVVAHGALDATALADGLTRGDALARAALSQPVEGSLLTAARDAAGAAAVSVADGGDLAATAAAAAAAAHGAASRSTAQLDVLARAGVVDAGARGLAVALGALAVNVGAPPTPTPVVAVPDVPPSALADPVADAGVGRWEVMYRLPAAAPGTALLLRDALDALGGSVSVVEDGAVVRAHVHTDDVDAAVAAGAAHGTPEDVTLEDLGERGGAAPAGDRARVVVGVDAPGLEATFAAAGAALVRVDASGALAPGALADAVGRVAGCGHATVVVVPGHPAVAAAAARLGVAAGADGSAADGHGAGPRVVVVDTATTAPGALAAVSTLLGEPDPAALAATAAAVRVGAVTPAAAAGPVTAAPTRAGSWVGSVAGEDVTTTDDPLAALRAVAAALAPDGQPELAQLHLGADVRGNVPGGVEAVVALLADAWPDAELEVLDARQRPALLVLGVE